MVIIHKLIIVTLISKLHFFFLKKTIKKIEVNKKNHESLFFDVCVYVCVCVGFFEEDNRHFSQYDLTTMTVNGIMKYNSDNS